MTQFKDIFRRKTSIWLTIELVLVTFACWWAFDPVIVATYVAGMPMGYDADRIVKFEVVNSANNKEQNKKWKEMVDEENILLQKVQQIDGVEMAYAASSTPIGFGTVSMAKYFYHDGDSVQCFCFGFNKDSQLFEVYGIQSLTPDVPTSELSHDCEEYNTIILTRSVAMKLFGTIDVAGRKLLASQLNFDGVEPEWVKDKYYSIRAVVEDVRSFGYDRECTNAFICANSLPAAVPIMARLREGVNASQFVQAHEQEVQRDLVTEHCYVRQMEALSKVQDKLVKDGHLGRQTRRNLLVAAFFAINLAFGVFGTLLMYTRQRREEAGVRRAFGATRWSVFWGFIREAWLLTTISVVIGCIIYFQFAVNGGLFGDFDSDNPINRYWFDDFGTHFLVVSAIVYLIILCAVLIATAIPAWRICRSEITEALKDE